ncbi:MAG: DNA-deoxyinosine glycosylase [Methylococcaceae bacterium]|nr:DNA-deoxyinosine glycosylase [Methylococcaceae bacterium]
MTEIFSFPPIARADARLLILGSMPGKASLDANQYYAHPRNLFWPIMGELVGAHPALDYEERARILIANGIALWDVLKSCRRSGSLDADIDKLSMIANDFVAFFNARPHIDQIFFNGATAEHAFRHQVLPTINADNFLLRRLPSTSPAHAALSYHQKLQSWRIILEATDVC